MVVVRSPILHFEIGGAQEIYQHLSGPEHLGTLPDVVSDYGQPPKQSECAACYLETGHEEALN